MADTTNLERYITSLETALARHFAPGAMYHGREGALRLAREVGYGLAGFPDSDVESEISGFYSRLLVRFTFGTSSGVPVSNKEFLAEMRSARNNALQKRGQTR